jgi:hypothetical protein
MQPNFPKENDLSGNPPREGPNDEKGKGNIEPIEKALFAITSMILASRGLAVILDLILQETLSCLNAHRSSIFTLGPDNGTMNIQCTRASHLEFAQVGLFEEKKLAGRVLEQNQPFLLNEPRDSTEPTRYGTGERKITSLMCVPLSLQDKTKMVLSALLINEARTFDQQDLLLLSILGNLASIALDHNHLFAEVRKGITYRRTYEQNLDMIQNRLQDLAKIENRSVEQNLQRFLPEKEEGESSDYKSYSNALSQIFNLPIISLKDFRLNSSLQKAIGEKYAANHKVIVLENSVDKIKLVLAEPTKYIMDELRRIVPPKKKIEFSLAIPDEVRLCFNKASNPFSVSSFK